MSANGVRPVPTAELLQAIEQRVRPTICQTFSTRGATVEGRISEDDFDTLLSLARTAAVTP